MSGREWLAERFEEHRTQLRAVAYRMLGSLSEADDAVQEAWVRLDRADADRITNLGGWLTTVVGRICLDLLRARAARHEMPLDTRPAEPTGGTGPEADPEADALLSDSVGLALLIVLDTLSPTERMAFVLHDIFAVPFDEIAPVIGRSAAAAKMLVSRARRRVQLASAPDPDHRRQREVVHAFLAAARGGDFEALLAVLDPDVTVRADSAAVPVGALRRVHGARAVARQALTFSPRARHARLAVVNGVVGIVVGQPGGGTAVVMTFVVVNGRISGIEIIANPARLRTLSVLSHGDGQASTDERG